MASIHLKCKLCCFRQLFMGPRPAGAYLIPEVRFIFHDFRFGSVSKKGSVYNEEFAIVKRVFFKEKEIVK